VKKFIVALKRLGPYFISGVFLVFAILYFDVDWSKISLPKSWLHFSVSLVLSFFVYSLQAFRWKFIIDALVIDNVPGIKTFFKFILVGTFWSTILPSALMGDVLKGGLLGARYKQKKIYVSAILLAKVMGLGSLFLICVSFSYNILAQNQLIILFSIFAFFLFLFLLLRNRIFKLFLNKIGITNEHLSLRQLCIIFINSLTIQFMGIASFYFLLCAFGAQINLWQVLSIYPLVSIVSLLPISIGGIGVREGTAIALFTHFTQIRSDIIFQASISIVFISISYGFIGVFGNVMFNFLQNVFFKNSSSSIFKN
jgi:hypothetical protein